MELRNDIEEFDEMEDIKQIKDNKIIEYAHNNVISINKKKKKGFTLVELIAVIAILAILGAIIVPQIFGYMARADKSKVQTDATIVLSAIQAYNADNSGTQIDTVNAAAQTAIIGVVPTIPSYLLKASSPWSVAQLTTIASGTGFSVTKTLGVYSVSIP